MVGFKLEFIAEFIAKEKQKCEKNDGKWNSAAKVCKKSLKEEKNKEKEDDVKMIVCTQEARMCPDGSFVGRKGPKCEFTKCPNENSKNNLLEEKETKKEKKEPVIMAQQTLLILDASGSMWGQIEGKTKIEIAKEVVKKTVKNFESTELGLMAYGHRRKGDCSDIEILTAPQKDNAENISKMVDGISPKGMTPMGASVLQAAESLKYTEQKATVILVSDGIETCDVDLCELGKKLEETGVDFTAHVIGFDMTEEQTAGLKCLAKETGGTFTSAKNADDLGKALEKTVEASSCSPEKLGEVTFTVPEKLSVNQKFDFSWVGVESKRRDAIGIFPKDETDWNNHLMTTSYLDDKNGKGSLTTPTTSGEYDLVYFADCGSILGRTPLSVGEVSATLTVSKTAPAGLEMTVLWTGPSNHNDDIGIFPKGSTEWNDHFNTFSYLNGKNGQEKITAPLQVGEYDMLYWLGGKEILARETFTVTEVTATLGGFPASVKKGGAFSISWTGPTNKGNAVTILPKGSSNWNDHVGGNLYHISDKSNDSGKLTAPDEVGEYDVVFWLRQKKILDRKTITVTE